ncbi:N(G),N(G)-dimethylarginine dimethylaminohydrolase [Caloramator mitchellensis]|uniref:N(G),N(G)-dimethylarginine dimethylaminohydrolase n=1 Tax=Caloramator mitchellensis TaxID=908809 RepID=A0A0R3JSP3_CALMK|nr:arginine deiminase-related protein [Caloramator mitchellensis]KRQ86531.1 N(G),N(G)-dimethylarginine dimethylaminohydrolase [Caloramator mitchellensis]
MFKNAIVKKPGESMIYGITTANLGQPVYELAIKQHKNYVDTLKKCGLEVEVLEADENYPDSCFIEDVALLTKRCAIITNPGAESRKGEIKSIPDVLKKYYENIEYIKSPGTIEAGDIMMVGDTFYIGLSNRTNLDGANQMKEILRKYGYDAVFVPLKEVLHLKTGVSYLENNNLLVSGEFIESPLFEGFNKIIVPQDEAYAANCIWVNGHVLVPEGFSKTKEVIENLGYIVEVVDVSEFRKLDGGLSCLSLRF